MSRPKHANQIPSLAEAIKDTAWKQIAASGAAALSLRAIARELGLTAPSIYHYYPSRDDLVTALIVDAFTALAGSQKAAVASLPPESLVERFQRLGFAYREWAIKHPQWYQLIFGTPIPGYHAPAEITVPAASLALVPLIESLQALASAGLLKLANLAEKSAALTKMLDEWAAFVPGADPEVLYLALIVWSRVHGLVSMEIGIEYPSFITDPLEIYQREIMNMTRQYLAQ